MSAAIAFSAPQAAIAPDRFWCAVDERLAEAGNPEVADWSDELADLYAQGLTVAEAVPVVVARRRVGMSETAPTPLHPPFPLTDAVRAERAIYCLRTIARFPESHDARLDLQNVRDLAQSILDRLAPAEGG